MFLHNFHRVWKLTIGPFHLSRHCLWILGNERTLANNQSVWRPIVIDAKIRQCFFNSDSDEDLAKAIIEVKKEFGQFDDMLNTDSILSKNSN